MFKRILHEDWTTIVPIFAFIITFVFFIIVIVRAIRMKQADREHLAGLPLDDQAPQVTHNNSSHHE